MRRSYGYDRVVGYERDVLTFISFTAAFLEAGENLSTYITCIARIIVPTNGRAS